MKILILGGGGREHAFAWRLMQEAGREVAILAAPGNPGIAAIGQCFPEVVAPEQCLELARVQRVDLTVVGPEGPLVAGAVDLFRNAGLVIAGPTAAAAQLEGSKMYAKQVLARAGVPTARAVLATSAAEAAAALNEFDFPIVVKADGLAAGKGVVIANNRVEAEAAIQAFGPKLVIEEFLTGEELSYMVAVRGEEFVALPASQDHKRLRDGDIGPNTGGMGAYTDTGLLQEEQAHTVECTIIAPVLEEMAKAGVSFSGFLYAGLMLTREGPKVLEFNVRLGDPEAQAVLMRLGGSFVDLLEFVAGQHRLAPKLAVSSEAAVCVVMAAAGYPEKPRLGDEIAGVEAAESGGAMVFHAGTGRRQGQLITNGGRVLGVAARASTLARAVERTYHGVGQIEFAGRQFRRDIGARGLKRSAQTADQTR